MKTADLVESKHFQGRVGHSLRQLELDERAAYLIDDDDEKRVLALATDKALVLFRQQGVPQAGFGAYRLDIELTLWRDVRGFALESSSLTSAADEYYLSVSRLAFESPALELTPRGRQQGAAGPFVAACIGALAVSQR